MTRGFVCSAFDLLHAGHILMLKECKLHCDHLTVGLHVNPQIERSLKNKPIQTIVERQIQLRGCRYVDDIIVYETERDLDDILITLRFDVRFLGTDHKDDNRSIARSIIPIKYIPRDHSYSTSELRSRIKHGN
jgi:glycerol-3-phosphate cytidylyltransferase